MYATQLHIVDWIFYSLNSIFRPPELGAHLI